MDEDRLEKLLIATHKVNFLHRYGLGAGLTDEELEIFNTAPEIKEAGQAEWGKLYAIQLHNYEREP